MVCRSLELVYRRNVEEFGAVSQKIPRIVKQNLLGHSGGSLEDQSTDKNCGQ